MTEEEKDERPEWSTVASYADRLVADAAARAAEFRAAFSDWRKVLDFEAQHREGSGAKWVLIGKTFDVPAVRYFQRLNQIIDMPEALEYAPALVYALREARVQRHNARVSTRRSRS